MLFWQEKSAIAVAAAVTEVTRVRLLQPALTIRSGFLVLVAAGIIALTASCNFVGRSRDNARLFDGDIWRNGAPTAEDPHSPRLLMVDAAIAQLTPGMTRDEIIAILGLPDREDESSMTWELGVRVIDFDSLVISLDANGRMTEATYMPG